ncbi:hypothetical protein Afil01_33140 [Actinorhabdospora filicis]|uniref:SH3b domain-containing protein n=1 Tax=Actinorhabdospora filicis TaxID=1785913 RepID=A0A9W6SM91_9ACTN|nr:hypothetical protein Afil01_33140 [Actinorhabdospora filicis]
MAALLADRRVGPVLQRCGDIPAAQCPCHTAAGDEDTVQRDGPDAGTGKKPPSLPLVGTACSPFGSKIEADLVHDLVVDKFLPAVASQFGSETESVWSDYLSRVLGVPRPLRQFDTPGGQIVGGFSRHPKTRSTQDVLVNLAAEALRKSPRAFPANTPVTVPLSDLVAPGTVWSTLNFSSDKMRFENPLSIPGLLAGGIDPAADTRNAWGELVITNHATPFGATTDVTIEPKLTFKVEDNVKFCPGNTGGLFIQPLTIPLSRLEATGTRFGAPYAGVTPFWVLFDGPGGVKSFGTTIPTTPAVPIPPTPPGPGPGPKTGPAHTNGTQLRLRSGPGTEHDVIGGFPQRDTPINVLEQAEGTEIRGNNLWDRVEGGWVSDSYVTFNA